MSDQELEKDRHSAIHLLRSGMPVKAVAEELGRSKRWVYKWKKRYETGGWAGLKSRSRAPKHSPHRYEEAMKQQICQTRSRLEAEAAGGQGLCYIGSSTVRAQLKRSGAPHERVPSTATIERVLRAAGMTRPYRSEQEPIDYPALHPNTAHQVQQVDIVPHHLPGGQAVACFNGLDVVSRYPTGQAFLQKTSDNAARFLLRMWGDLGVPTYTQMDNESCFCGGHTHPYVLGKVVRLCLLVGTQPVFIPIRHPASNGSVERFHQAYNRHVWQRYYLDALPAVNTHSDHFMALYRSSHFPKALAGQTPQQVHRSPLLRKLPARFTPPLDKLPITEGHIHFIRKVEEDGTIPVLNVRWDVPGASPRQAVWATLSLSCSRPHATLSVFSAAPGITSRSCLVAHPFPLSQEVIPLRPEFQTRSDYPFWYRPLAQAVHWLCTML
jgi:putative transposase